MQLAAYDFKLPPLLEDDEIESVLGKPDGLVSWANSLKEYAFKVALGGKKWLGFKIVEGVSKRKYTDESKVAVAAKQAGYRDIYRQSLIPLGEMERLLGKEKFKAILGGLVIKPRGKLALVAENDKRQAMDISTATRAGLAADDFADFNENLED